MNKILRSELLKLKGSFALNLILILAIIQLSTIPLYLYSTNNSVVIENIIFLPMLGYCILAPIFSILLHEQEEKANSFQNIKSEKNRATLWGMKLISTDLLMFLLGVPVWVVVGFEFGRLSYYIYVAVTTWLLLILLNHFHMLLSLIIGKGGNLVIAFIECLFIIFATNKVFLNSFWLPIALPVNLILEFGENKIFMNIMYLIGFIILLYICNLAVVNRFEIQKIDKKW
ncbi:TPA: ABC transporter permease [Streptococcus equi subsp. zooepidemicus]|nr:ABC transporter permease [Streptococcus equi subsp. zooepidemicus]HEL1179431.1 ABC transporter permease [Streptococcus equi subsp. zooepidemicus]HEL1236198.1 ABC transporter permease [Streptococcus equi subsp. zooepidemicus]